MEIAINNEIRERFIPVTYNELLTSCLKYFNKEEDNSLLELGKRLHLYYYHSFYDELQRANFNYQPFNPDSDVLFGNLNKEEYTSREKVLFEQVEETLNDANYEELTEKKLEDTMNEVSPYGVSVYVDFADFNEVRLYFRGQALQYDKKRDPWKLFLTHKEIVEPIYSRLFLVIKPKHLDVRAEEISKEQDKKLEKVRKKLLKNNKLLITDEKNHNVYIKLFKNIPQKDLAMLFPNTKVRMTMFDKVKLGVMGGGGAIFGGISLIAKMALIATNPIGFLIALGSFFGLLFRQVKEVFNRRTQYIAQLANNLYFHNLDNNAGALNYVIDMARDEESKEALLAYIFLNQSKEPLSEEELDKQIEDYILKFYEIDMDFEVDDGLRKLRELGLLIEEGNKLSTLPFDETMEQLKNLLTDIK